MELARGEFHCISCTVNFSSKSNLYRHLKRMHFESTNTAGSKECPMCDSAFKAMDELCAHLTSVHDVILKFGNQTFYCDQDFEAWLRDLEKSTQSRFVVKNRVSGDPVRIYYECNRSGKAKLKENRARRMKCSGSFKLGKTCPAFVKVTKTAIDGATELTVYYQIVHVGHKAEVGKIYLRSEERQEVACLLQQGASISKVLSEIRKTHPPSTRLGLLNYHDIWNIKRDFAIDEEVVFGKSDAVSVEIKVRKMQDADGNPVLLYKPIDESLPDFPMVKKEEFMLAIMTEAQQKILELYGNEGISIDSTHGMNQYGFQVTTVLCIDDNREGIPVAVLFSSRTTEETFMPFFQAIKNRLCINLKPKFFMSDDAPAFYNAWKKAFGEVDNRLLCTWHIKRAWTKNLCSKVKNIPVRDQLKLEVMSILHETDEITFLGKLDAFFDKHLTEEETTEFAKYLKENYAGRCKQWAYCYRKNVGINTNMRVERWHRQLKYEEGNGKVIKRLDKALSLVLRAVSNRLINRLISIERGKLSTVVKQLRQRHMKVHEMKNYTVIEMEAGKSWTVTKNTNNQYLDVYNVEFAKICECNIKCDECSACIHMFQCTCIDYAVRMQMCKHIHFILCKRLDSSVQTVEREKKENDELYMDVSQRASQVEEEKQAIIREISKKNSTELEKRKAKCLIDLKNIVNSFNNDVQSPELLEVIENAVKTIKQAQVTLSKDYIPVSYGSSTSSTKRKLSPQRKKFQMKSHKKKHQN